MLTDCDILYRQSDYTASYLMAGIESIKRYDFVYLSIVVWQTTHKVEGS